LQVHHVTPISEGGERYGLDNLVTKVHVPRNAQRRTRRPDSQLEGD
jgi:hypothetical protein